MEEVIVKEVDSQGRISIPVDWRRKWKSRKLVLRKIGNRIELIPIEPTLPSEMFDAVEIQEDVDFTDPHSLKKALLELSKH